MKLRTLRQKITGMPATDGAGVKLTRSIGARPGLRLDPFLMLDEFSSDSASDYIAGFPPHPHRGFQTVTYMLDGHMLHEDHMGNQGHLLPGGVQWMVAGSGIIHSEMPQQDAGRMRGFQLWVNLPAARKMEAPSYRDLQAEDLPQLSLAGGVSARLIAGEISLEGQHWQAPVTDPSTQTLYLDLHIPAGSALQLPLPTSHNAFVYPYEGTLELAEQTVPAHVVGLLSDGDAVELAAAESDVRLLLIAGQALGEPVAQYGPFVMNTREEIEQARLDYAQGQLTNPAA